MICAIILLYCLINVDDKVERYVSAIAVWTTCCFVITEVMSVFSAISTVNLWICWLGLDVILFLLLLLKYKNNKTIGLEGLKSVKVKPEWIAGGIFGVVMIGLAIKTVPYNYDSMTYHLPRIFYWFRNGTVSHYATHIDRQVANPVLGEFVNLHVYAMVNGNDWFVNLLQCCSYLTNGILVYHIAKKLECSSKYCFMATVLFYSSPIAFAEAFTTQVDNYSALWMLCLVYIILELLNRDEKLQFDRLTVFRVIMLSLCVGFSYLSKPSIGIGMIFFALWLLFIAIKRKDSILVLVKHILIAGGILGVLLAPEFFRNISTFDALLAPVTSENRLIGTMEPKYIFVNFVKNFTFNMSAAWIPGSAELALKGVEFLAEVLNVELDNPVISTEGRRFFIHEAQTYGHDTAVNPIIIYLLIICIIFFVIKEWKKCLIGKRNQYFVVTCLSFFALCAVARWEPYNSRYMVAFFGILCPVLLGKIEEWLNKESNGRKELIFCTIFYFLCVSELWGLLYCHGNMAMEYSRYEGYFTKRKAMVDNYEEVIDIIENKNYEKIGLMLGSDSLEYPFLVMLGDCKISHVNVENPTVIYENSDFVPEAIIMLDQEPSPDGVECHGTEYEVTHISSDSNTIYLLEKRQ